MQIIHKITLDTEKQGIQAMIPATHQDGNSHIVMVSFSASGRHIRIQPGTSAALYCKKPDGTEILSRAICYSFEGAYPDTVSCDLGSAVFQAPGAVEARVIVTLDDSVLFSPRFGIRVDGNIFADNDIASVSEYSELICLAGQTEDLTAAAEAWAAGTVNGDPVGSDAPQYHNNAKYFANSFVLDSEMSASSENGVKNNVIKAYVDGAINDAIESAISSALNTPV